ncbi:MAG: YbgC/FadM family acyl-CoA thioesterase, partial [Alphaproteobacteria bacterium]|nr:YbgC/FadM family acyl-CoA thioesterase [Alphaproteobacteria bacterium]
MSHETPVRVYYEDTDIGGIVYYANYLKYIERGRSELVELLGMNQMEMRDKDGIVFVVTRVVADYLGPARLDDRLIVHTAHRA